MTPPQLLRQVALPVESGNDLFHRRFARFLLISLR